jgi:hypothetical protein
MHFLSVIRHNKVFKNQILIKNKESLIFLLQRNKLKLALPQILFHNAPMLHCNIDWLRASGHVRADVSSGPIPLLDP